MVMFFPCILGDSKFTVDLLQMKTIIVVLDEKNKKRCHLWTIFMLHI